MENNTVNNVTQQILDSVSETVQMSFEFGMKYKRLEVVQHLVPILRENEFDELTISAILSAAKLLEDDTYANIFTNDSE